MRSNVCASVLCTGGLLFAMTAAIAANQLQDVLAKNHRAVYNPTEQSKITSISLDLHIAESDYELTAWYRATVAGQMRIDLYAGENRVFSEGIDEHGAWEWPASQETPQAVDHEGANALQHGIEFNLHSLSELLGRGHSVEWIGTESLLEAEYDVLKVTLLDGFETYRFVNHASGLVDVSRDFRAFHPGIDLTKQQLETRYDRWLQIDGITRAMRSRTFDLASGELVATATVQRVEYNVASERLGISRDFGPASPPSK